MNSHYTFLRLEENTATTLEGYLSICNEKIYNILSALKISNFGPMVTQDFELWMTSGGITGAQSLVQNAVNMGAPQAGQATHAPLGYLILGQSLTKQVVIGTGYAQLLH